LADGKKANQKFEGKDCLIVPEAAILVLMRDEDKYEDDEDFDEQ